MSLTGTLLSGVAGLKAQTNAMAILSDNISNINTIGYKKSIATFSTLVVNSAAATRTYSPGGVASGRFALVDSQGVLQASNRPLDVSISGNGFFAVNTDGNGNGEDLYTRAGQFHEDSQGRLVNSAGMFLMGWTLDQNGVISNINQIDVLSVGTLNGVAVDTTEVSIGANIDSQETDTTGIFDTDYDAAAVSTPGSAAANLATNTSPPFRRAIQVFDSLGTLHNLTLTMEKLEVGGGVTPTPANAWGFVLHAETASEVVDLNNSSADEGIVGYGYMTFNGDGSLGTIVSGADMAAANAGVDGGTNIEFYTTSTGTPQGIPVHWTNGAAESLITFNFGTPGAVGTGLTDGITQFASDYNVAFINQNGSAVGLRTGVSIDKDGFVVASFSNGATQSIYQVPITTFADPTQLEARNGNAFAQTVQSGSFNWRIANTGGAGRVEPSSLETSNADLGDEFSSMIVTQRAYSANAKTISTADEMLEELLRIKR